MIGYGTLSKVEKEGASSACFAFYFQIQNGEPTFHLVLPYMPKRLPLLLIQFH